MRVILSVALSLFFAAPCFAQDGDYRSTGTGDWEQIGSWEVFSGGTWVPAISSPTDADGVITIGEGHTITITSNVSANQIEFANNFTGVTGTLVVASGATLTVVDEVGDDIRLLNDFLSIAQLVVEGTLELQAGATIVEDDYFGTVGPVTPLTYHVTSGGVHVHETGPTADQIPNADWQPGSTCRVRALGGANPIIPVIDPSTVFYDFEWDGTGQAAVHNLNGALLNVANDFLITTTGGSVLQLTLTTAYTLSIGGNFTIAGNSRVFFAATANVTVNIGGDFAIASSNTSPNTITLATTGSATINVEGSFNKSGVSSVSLGAAPTGSGTINVGGGFDFSGGTITRGAAGTGSATINFAGSSPQSYTNTGGTFPGTAAVNFHIQPNAVVNFGTSSLGGGGTFTNDGTIHVGSLNAGGAVQGNIPLPTRVFNPGSTVIYDGAGAQFMTVSTPGAVNTIIGNPNGVSLGSDVTIGGNLTLTSGSLNVGAHTLTLGGSVTPNGNSIVVAPNSSIVVNGSGPFGTFPFPAGSQTLTNFTLNRANGAVTFADDVTITGSLSLDAGNLDFSGVTLTLNGTFGVNDGLLASNSDQSALTIGGDGAFGTLAFDPTANVVGTLTINRTSGTAALNSKLVVQNEFNVLKGTFTNTSGLVLGDGAVLRRDSGGEFLGTAPANGSNERYSVRYTGGSTYTTGIELPTTTNNDLLNLTIEAPVTLDKSIIVNGDLILSNSTLSGGSNITMAGQPGLWSTQGGSFDPAGGTVTITGDITIESPNTIPQFFNLVTSEGSTLTLPSGTVDIRGNLEVNPGSTFNANGGTIELNGDEDQVVSGGNKDFNNLTINKTGGDVQLTSMVRLNGILDVATATLVEADGNLTVVSTSDGTSGNGSIGRLATGASISGDVTVQRFMSEEGRIYRYISSPVSGATVAQLQDDFYITGAFDGADTGCSGCSSNPSMFYYDETVPGISQEGYFQFPVASNQEVLESGRGYAAFIRDNIIPGPVTIDVTGPINQGTVVLPVTHTDNGNNGHDGYNLVGNPFPATINWNASSGWGKQNIALPIAVRDNGDSGGFLYWDGATGGLPNGNIATGQAFWVRVNAGGSLSVNENAKVTTTGEFFRERQEPVDVLQIVLSNNTFTDRAYFRYRPEATGSLDDYDAPKFDNELFDIATLSDDDMPMAINATNTLPCGNTIRLHMKDLEPGSYTLSTEASGVFLGVNTRLVDNFTNNTIDFSTTPQYAFSVTNDPQSNVADRFSIILEDTPIDPSSVTPSLADECEVENYQITLEGAQKGIYYFAEIAGNIVGDSVLADGSETITLSVPTSELTIGSNEVVLRGYNYCTTVPIAADLTINHDQIYAVTSNDVTDCADAQVTLEASGAPANGSYNWYEEEASEAPIEGQHASIFTTPALPKSKTYYVAAVNARGCEGPRVPVKANVVPFDPVEITEAEPGQFVSSYAEGNQWYWDGEVIEGATSNTYTATKSGTYTVEVNLEGCITSASADFLVTGIDEFAADRMLSPYENPFRNVLRIHVNSTTPVEQMSVFNTMGSKVGDLSLTRSGNVTEGVIDMTSSTSGMYLVKTLLEGRVYTIKVIKK